MTIRFKILTVAAFAAMALAAPAAFAQPSPAFQRAILAEVNPATRAEIERRATGGNSVSEVLEVILLNNLQLANAPQAKVVAVDFGRGVAVVESQGNPLRVIAFDTATLMPKR